MKIRCRKQGTFCGKPYAKFKCRHCKRWVCGSCEGTHDEDDPVGNRICDPCWKKRAHRLTPESRERFGIRLEAA